MDVEFSSKRFETEKVKNSSESFTNIPNNENHNIENNIGNVIRSGTSQIKTEHQYENKNIVMKSDPDSVSSVYRTNSSDNLFIEIPVENGDKNYYLFNADESIILSDKKINDVFSTGFEQCEYDEKSNKNLLSEISEILLSLSEDEKFCECINYSNNHEFRIANKESCVDLIFTYNVLNILFNKLKQLKSCYENVQIEKDKLFKENQKIKAEHEAYQIQVESLEKTIDEQKQEIILFNQKLIDIENYSREKRADIIEKLESELKSIRKKYENAINEKDAAVMRYAKNESELISVRKEKHNLTKRLKNVENERDEATKKCKTLTNDKNSASQMLDVKKNELINALKDVEKLKEELSCKDIKSKWIEENFQKELALYKDQCTQMTIRINDLEKDLKEYKNNENLNSEEENECYNTVFVNGKLSEIEINADERNDIEYRSIHHEKGNNLIEENNSLTLKVQKFETERLDYEKNLMKSKQTTENQIQKITDLQNQLIEMESLRSTVKQMQDTIASYQSEINRLKETNDELRQDMESCREREAEILSFTEKLTAKNVVLQSEYTVLEAKKMSLESDRVPIDNRVIELEEKINSLAEKLKKEMKLRNECSKQSATRLEEKIREIEALNARLEEQQAENQSLKHKYSSSIRELTKEVHQYRKYKQYEANKNSGGDSVCFESRTSSCNSLNEQQVPPIEPDRQTLIERIVKLQRINAKYVEKIEFLEEHVSQLLTEVKKKSRVLQYYIIREQSGALSSEMMDQNKTTLKIQAEMSKYGGIMASLYNSKCDEGSISLELSLEINRKLQAVLEDTLLKNITLKENIETLGKEIAKLTIENKLNSN